MSNTPNTTATTTLILPVTVRNIREARNLCHEYDSVLTAGPEAHEVRDFNHPDHKVVSFADSVTPDFGPSYEHVEEMINWGADRKNILVHCHAGISRSTATAWGIAIAHGHQPEQALAALQQAHPAEYHHFIPDYIGNGYPHKRIFAPNKRLVAHLERFFGYEKGRLLTLIGSSAALFGGPRTTGGI